MNNGDEFLQIPVVVIGAALAVLTGLFVAMAVCGDSGVSDE
jgi:hypothetical protein